MKTIFFTISLLISFETFAQTLGDLDQKNGFKEFKINDDISVHIDKIKLTKILTTADSKLYLVKEPVSVRTFNGEVELVFYKDKLAEIIVSFKNSSEENFNDLLKSLETLYGKSQPNKDKTLKVDRFEKVLVWNGKVVGLRLCYDANYKQTQMVYVGQKSLDKLKEEF